MNRRLFLQSLATLIAASQLPSSAIASALDAAPIIDWSVPVNIGVALTNGVSQMFIDNQDITRFPSLVAGMRK
jgi:hypothetical protein